MRNEPDPEDTRRRETAASTVKFLQANCKHIDLKALEQTTNTADLEFFVELMTAFRSESKRFMEAMRGQFSRSDFYAVGKTAHSLKPAGSYLGVHALTVIVTKIERLALSANNREVNDLITEAEILVDAINAEIDVCLKILHSQ